MQGYLKDVGIEMEIDILDVAEWVGTYLYDIPEGMIYGPRHSFGSNIVNQVMGNFSHDAIDGVGMLNKCKIHPDDLDDALKNAVSARDEEDMLVYFHEACELLFDKYCLAYTLANANSSVVIARNYIVDEDCFCTNSDYPNYNLISRK